MVDFDFLGRSMARRRNGLRGRSRTRVKGSRRCVIAKSAVADDLASSASQLDAAQQAMDELQAAGL
jgi:hypothetical protein